MFGLSLFMSSASNGSRFWFYAAFVQWLIENLLEFCASNYLHILCRFLTTTIMTTTTTATTFKGVARSTPIMFISN